MNGDWPALDTNILIYVYSADARKTRLSREIVERGGLVSVQALNEFTHVARRNLRFSWKEVRDAVDIFATYLDVRDISYQTHTRAVKIAEGTGYSIYDALMLAVALENGAKVFLSEDMQHRRAVEGMEIRNPFVS